MVGLDVVCDSYSVKVDAVYLRAILHYALAHEISVIVTLINRTKQSVMSPTGSPNYTMSNPFSKPVATSLRTAEQPRPEPPTHVKRDYKVLSESSLTRSKKKCWLNLIMAAISFKIVSLRTYAAIP
jgi:hypothetical protein